MTITCFPPVRYDLIIDERPGVHRYIVFEENSCWEEEFLQYILPYLLSKLDWTYTINSYLKVAEKLNILDKVNTLLILTKHNNLVQSNDNNCKL